MKSEERIEVALREMERIQARLGKVQVTLLDVLTDEQTDQWDQIAHDVLITLEGIQRKIGETQVDLISGFRVRPAKNTLEKTVPETGSEDGASKPPEEIRAELPVINPRIWLKQRGLKIIAEREEKGIDQAAKEIAVFLGDHYGRLENFYQSIKRTVNGDRGNKWFPAKELPKQTIESIITLGNKLKACSFLAEFFYNKRDKAFFFVPLEDGRVKNFFTGEWFEEYTLATLERVHKKTMGTWNPEQALCGAKVMLPDERETEFDLLVGIALEEVLWIECKTGNYSNYTSRLKEMNERFLRLPDTRAALAITDPLTEAEKQAATSLSGLKALHLSELEAWFTNVLQSLSETNQKEPLL